MTGATARSCNTVFIGYPASCACEKTEFFFFFYDIGATRNMTQGHSLLRNSKLVFNLKREVVKRV